MNTVSSNIEFHQDSFKQILQNLHQLYQKWQAIFEWQDGPLVEAMNCGDFFLMDEISLADDSVLERLNSILEPERVLVWFLSFLQNFVSLAIRYVWLIILSADLGWERWL